LELNDFFIISRALLFREKKEKEKRKKEKKEKMKTGSLKR